VTYPLLETVISNNFPWFAGNVSCLSTATATRFTHTSTTAPI